MSDLRRILLLGLDGATWTVLRPLIDEGHLPNLAALIARGASGILRSSTPPVTAPAWTTFHTGANPGRHGVYDFRTFDRASHQLSLVTSTDIRLPLLWEVASRAGRRVVVINAPLTYPPRPVNGVMIGGMLAPRVDASLLWPPERFADLFGHHPDYRISPPTLGERHNMGDATFIQANIDVERARCELALDLMQREPWDLFMVQNQCLDYIQHAYMHHLDPASPQRDRAALQAVLSFYRAMDDNVGRLAAAAPADADIVVLSDHGFQRQHRLISLAPWLRAQGLLVEQISGRQRLLQIARRLDVLHLRRRFTHWVLRDKRSRFSAAGQATVERIDWSRSQAFVAIGSVFGCVFVNRALVANPDALAREIAANLAALEDPRTGQPVVRQVWLGQELYHGPFAAAGPDVVAEPAPGYTFGAPALVPHPTPFFDIDQRYEIPGGHHPNGIIVWCGAGVQPRADVQANLMDVAPTALARSAVPIPRHMDGRLLAELWPGGLSAAGQDWEAAAADVQAGYDRQEEAELRDRLAGLGYL